MNNKEKTIERIRKILALAANNPNENEALSATLKAQEMMAKFHIEEKDLDQELTESNIDEVEVVLSGKTQKWRLSLAVVLAKNFRCKVFLRGTNVVFYGYEEDANICKEVFQSLYIIGSKLSDKLKREIRKEKGTATGIKNTFCIGFVEGIKQALEVQCTALMIVIPKEVEEEYKSFSSTFKKTTSTSVKIKNDKDIYDKGFAEGKNAMQSKQIGTK